MHFSPLPELPNVSYVMPVLNEAAYLERAVRAVLAQEYAGVKELVLALGPSRDDTSRIAARLAAADSRIVVVQNPGRDIPVGLNLAIAASSHPVVIRVDAHSELAADYTRIAVAALRSTGAANVGGVMRAAGQGVVQRAIAASYNSVYGLGGGTYHRSDARPGQAESAYLGVFRREAIDQVGGYDPTVLRGEDWELNLRIRAAGGAVYFDPALRVTYWPRASYLDLARQFFATGAWRAVLVRRHPWQTPWRFFVPGALVIALVVSGLLLLLQLCDVLPWPWWSLMHVPSVGYLIAVCFASTRLPELRGMRERLFGLRALITMHLCWGAGFVSGSMRHSTGITDRSRVTD